MFGFYLPPDPFSSDPFADESGTTKTTDDIKIGSIWKDSKDNSLWRVTHKDCRIHVMNLATDEIVRHGINIFFTSFSVVEFGAVCCSCKKEYQYTEKKHEFECWACKNGA